MRSLEVLSPLVAIDSRGKGKVLETPSSKLKKRRLVKALEEEPKKTKLLAFAMLTVEAVEVCLYLYFRCS